MNENSIDINVDPQIKHLELLIQELQNRIGQMTSNYEVQLAVLKAQATQEIQARDSHIAQLMQQGNSADVQEEN